MYNIFTSNMSSRNSIVALPQDILPFLVQDTSPKDVFWVPICRVVPQSFDSLLREPPYATFGLWSKFLGRSLYWGRKQCIQDTFRWPQSETGSHLGGDHPLLHQFPLNPIWKGDLDLHCIFLVWQLLQMKTLKKTIPTCKFFLQVLVYWLGTSMHNGQ